MTPLVVAWVLLAVLTAMAATIPPMPYKGVLAAGVIATFCVAIAWGSSEAVDCYPDCSAWQITLGWLLVWLPVGTLLLYPTVVIGGHLQRRRRTGTAR